MRQGGERALVISPFRAKRRQYQLPPLNYSVNSVLGSEQGHRFSHDIQAITQGGDFISLMGWDGFK